MSGFRVEVGGHFRADTTDVDCSTVQTDDSGADILPETSASQRGFIWLDQAQLPDHLRALLGDNDAVATDIQSDAQAEYITFSTQASLLDTDTNDTEDVYLYHTHTEVLSLVSMGANGEAGSDHSGQPRISAAGEFVVYQSQADDLNAFDRDTNGVSDIYLYHVGTAQNYRASWQMGGNEATYPSANPGVSVVDPYVVYDKPDSQGQRHVYGFDFADLQTTSKLSLNTGEDSQVIDNQQAAISIDGRYLAYLEISQDTACQVHIYDRVSLDAARSQCPHALTIDTADWVSSFDVTDGHLHRRNTRSNRSLPPLSKCVLRVGRRVSLPKTFIAGML